MIKVIDNVSKETQFGLLEVGATFKGMDRNYYIKVSAIEDSIERYNVVNLSNGEFDYFNAEDIVIPFNSELSIL